MAAEGLGVVAKLATGDLNPLICRYLQTSQRDINVKSHTNLMSKIIMFVTGFVNTRVSIDNWSFKFYYKYTTSLLLLCSAGTTAR